jgi:hypothetical protein
MTKTSKRFYADAHCDSCTTNFIVGVLQIFSYYIASIIRREKKKAMIEAAKFHI